jgi:hypothetical protein
MTTYPIPYAEVSAPATDAFPRGRVFRRPVLSLALQNGQNRLSCYGIVDSGADYCLFPRSFMLAFGGWYRQLDLRDYPGCRSRSVGKN